MTARGRAAEREAELAGGSTQTILGGHERAGGAARLPDFFVVGQPKSGTTALYEMLRAHPQIFMPASKEPWYFAEELLERTPPRPEGTPRTLAEYSAWFADAGEDQRAGEASALYLWSRTAASRIAEACPDARIVAILREPASLLRSLHLQFLRTHVETEADFATALGLEPARRRGQSIPSHTYWPRALLYSEHVRYVQQLRRYHAVFPRDRVLVLIYDDFRADNRATLRQVLSFLGVDEGVAIDPVEMNPSVRPRSQPAAELLHALAVGRGPVTRALKAAGKALTPAKPRRRMLSTVQRRVVFAPAEKVDERLMSSLRAQYAEEVRELSDYIGRDLVSLWGYDRLA